MANGLHHRRDDRWVPVRAGFSDVAIARRFDCFLGTTKERTARRYGVVGVNVTAKRSM
jgi:hypothetical protein